jgi:hypothetical protein
MSQSALIAEQTKYRQVLLKALQPYESHVAFVERLAYWDRPLHTVGAAIVFTIALKWVSFFLNFIYIIIIITRTSFLGFFANTDWSCC